MEYGCNKKQEIYLMFFQHCHVVKVHFKNINSMQIWSFLNICSSVYNFSPIIFSFRMRKDDDGQRNYLSLPACIAPLKASVLPLSNNEEFAPIVKIISKSLTEAEISHKVDETSGSIGKRYARTGSY